MLRPDTPLMGRGGVVLVVCVILLLGALVMGPWQRGRSERAGSMEAANVVAGTRERGGGPVPAGGRPAGAGDASSPGSPAPVAGEAQSVELGAAHVVMPLPQGYGLVDGEDGPPDDAASDACPQVFDYCLYASAVNGAEAAGLGVRLRDDLESEANCVLEPPSGFEDNLPSVSGSRDHAAALFGTVARPSGDAVETLSLRRLAFRGDCFEFVSRVVTTGGERADAARRELDALVDRVSLPDGRSALWSGRR